MAKRKYHSMITLGLVGGVACGKSLVAQHFQTLGACVVDGDRLGHDVLRVEGVRKKLIDRWGSRVANEDGELSRSAIASIVFGGSKKAASELSFLESVAHPEIEKLLTTRLGQIEKLGRFPMAVLDAAVMIKAGWDKLCDYIVFVDVPRALRLKRGLLRGLDEQQFSAREAAQMSVEQKKARADIVIDNSGTPQQTFQQVQKVWHSVVEIA